MSKLKACFLPAWIFALLAQLAVAQLAPSGAHYAGRPTDTGYGGSAVDATGNIPVVVPLEIPPAHGGLPLPLQITYITHGVGAAGLGWDVPLSYIQQNRTLAHHRPTSAADQTLSLPQHTILSLIGQAVELLPQGPNWVARIGTLELQVHQDGSRWLAYDGQGRTYIFTGIAILPGEGLWLLTEIDGVAGSKVELNYQITTPALNGGIAFAIDLIGIGYNFGGSDIRGLPCARNGVTLSYSNGSSPISLSTLNDQILVRERTLSAIDITSHPNCRTLGQRLRRYVFAYTADVDSGLPRLATVTLFGRQGTPEETTAIPVAAYSYGSATNNGALRYQLSQKIDLPGGVSDNQISGTDSDSSANVPEAGDRYATWQTLTDFNGDGRPDLVFKRNGKLWIAKNQAAPNGATTLGVGPQALVQLSDNTFNQGGVATQSSSQARFNLGPANRNTTDVWRMAIDINGDGRIDIIDAAEEADHWVVYLNTPGGPSGVQWQRRSFSVKSLREMLTSLGHVINGNHLPLSRRATGNSNLNIWQCWRWENGEWNWYSTGFSNHRCQGDANTILARGPEQTFTEWDLVDLNGDGYPDFVFDSSPVDFQVNRPSQPGQVDGETFDGKVWEQFAPGSQNQIRAAFNVRGVRFDTDTEVFSAGVNLNAAVPQNGVSLWICPDPGSDGSCHQNGLELQNQIAGFADVNGDGLLDRVVGSQAYLGLYPGTASAFSPIYLTLPGPLATQLTTHDQQCKVGGGQKPIAEQIQGLRDLTGDGIPDYYDHGKVWIGTGTGFQVSIPIVSMGANFQFSHETETCTGDQSNTDGGLYDIDGDGKPEVVGLVGNTFYITSLVGQTPGSPEAGQLTGIDNGFGAKTTIGYVSAKQFTDNLLPYPEIVVSSVSTNSDYGLGESLAGTRYAYGGGQLIFDTALDRFAFRGYGRQVALQLLNDPVTAKGAPGLATITDTWPLTPFSIPLTMQQRWLRSIRAGLVSDVYTMRAVTVPDPWVLLEVPATDPHLISDKHYEYDAKLYEVPLLPSENVLECFDIVYPLDYQQTLTTLTADTVDVCRTHGFAYQSSQTNWRGDTPPALSDQYIQTRVRALSVDDFGRPLVTAYDNDVFRSDDDVCVKYTYATPATPQPRVLTALASRSISTCGKGVTTKTVASDSWTYDARTDGSVTDGHITSHDVDRRATDTGLVLNTIHQFDATYDGSGNLSTLRTVRGGATRTTTIVYDPFGLVPVSTNIDATGLASTPVTFTYDPISLLPVSSTDVNQVVHGIDYDGFGRPIRSTITVPGDTQKVLSTMNYLGFAGADPAGRRVTVTRFVDPILPVDVATTTGRSATTYLDELGRERQSELNLGSDYAGEVLVLGARQYDGAGRLVFLAQSYPKTQSTPPYGSSFFFDDSGDLECIVQAFGRQSVLNTSTDTASQSFPSCLQRSFAGHVYTLDARDPSSLQSGSPQAGVLNRTVSTAIGRMLERSSWQAGSALERATFSYDALGQTNSVTRFLDAVHQSGPVAWTRQLDSLGQMIQFSVPASAQRAYTYSDWGELARVDWSDGAIHRTLANTYDSLNRLIRAEELDNGVSDPATVTTYQYDTAVTASPLVTPTFVAGHMTAATSPNGSVAFSYDPFGQVNAQVMTDGSGGSYIVTEEHHADGTRASLTFRLPDNGFNPEAAEYGYDSAGRLRTVNFADQTGSRTLFSASTIDAFGRVRSATYGASTSYQAVYADDGRRLIQEAQVQSGTAERRLIFGPYDPVGRELSRQEFLDGSTTGSSTTLVYDALGRLATAARTSGPTTNFNWSFAYDALGNVDTLAEASGNSTTSLTYRSDDRDRVCRVKFSGGLGFPWPFGWCNVSYDALGRITSEPLGSGSRKLTYFGSGRTRTINQPLEKATFGYDPFGGLQSIDVQVGARPARHEAHFGAFITRRETMTANGNSSLLIRSIPGPDGIMATRRGPTDDWVDQFSESRGNRFFAGQAGSFVQDVNYQPFGAAQSTGASPGSTDYTPDQWNDGELLEGFGVNLLGARVYDPGIGRFLSRDPVSVPRTASTSNPYAFANNDPWNAGDPTGLDCGGNFGQECDYLAAVGIVGLAVAALDYLTSGSGPSTPAAAAPPVSSGPYTKAGAQLYAEAFVAGVPIPKGFNVDTLAATGISQKAGLEAIRNAPSPEREAAIDAYNAKIARYENYSRAVGWTMFAVGTGGVAACEVASTVLLSQGMIGAAEFVGGSTVSTVLGGATAAGGGATSAVSGELAEEEVANLEQVVTVDASAGEASTEQTLGYNYRGVPADHPNIELYRNGEIVPGDVNGSVTAAEHNLYGDDPAVQANSPFTSWTTDPAYAAQRAGEGGVVLRLPQGAPPPGASWSWELSDDVFLEKEVLLRGTRSGAEVVPQ